MDDNVLLLGSSIPSIKLDIISFGRAGRANYCSNALTRSMRTKPN